MSTIATACLRAETLFERLARLARAFDAPPALEDAAVAAALEPWRRAVARGDGEAFARRLAWDGIDPRVAALAFVEPVGAPDGPWCVNMERWLHAVATRGLASSGSELAAGLPFGEWVASWVAEAASRARQKLPALDDLLTPAAWLQWQRALGGRLAWIAALPLYERFDLERSARGEAGALARFLAALGASPTASGLELPGLVRQLAGRAEDWIDAGVEWIGRLAADRAGFALAFEGDADPGRVVAVEAGLSDPHARGRRVLALTFESGLEVIYKPRPVDLESAWWQLASELAEAGFEAAPLAARTLARPGYGWMERVAAGGVDSASEAESWFRRAGALVALAWVLGGRDLHAENLIADRRGPVLVDAEMLLAPEPGALLRSGPDSVLATGLVADPAATAGPGAWGYAGLDLPEPGELPEADRHWENLGTDRLRLAWRRFPRALKTNVLRWRGRPQRPEAWREAVLEGFDLGMAAIGEQRERIERWLAARGDTPTRVLFRPSAQYATTVALSVRPRYANDGLAGSLLREALLQPLVGLAERPALWPLIADERAALEALDLPVFHLPAGATALTNSAGERIEGLFEQSGIAAARARLAELDAERIERERRHLAAALEPRRLGRAEEESRLAAAAAEIAGALAMSKAFAAVPAPGASLRELALYGGAAGRALFAAGAWRATGGAAWASIAGEIASGLVRALAAVPAEAEGQPSRPGGTDGWGSILWTLVTLAELLEQPELLAGAAAAGERLEATPRRPDLWGFDLAAGEAGALLGWLALAQASGEAAALERARDSGQRLLSSQLRSGPDAGGWPAPGGSPPLAGFAHGASGIARALDALAAATGEGEYRDAAGAALRFESSLFDRQRGDWPARIAGGGRRFLCSWCHGAPGVAIARALRLAAGGEDRAAATELATALATLAGAPLPEVDHLCCGTAGRLAAQTVAGRWGGGEEALAAGRRLARRALARAEGSGGWRIPAEPPAERPDLGLFRGYPGLAWSLISLTDAGGPLPLVAALELPAERRRRSQQ